MSRKKFEKFSAAITELVIRPRASRRNLLGRLEKIAGLLVPRAAQDPTFRRPDLRKSPAKSTIHTPHRRSLLSGFSRSPVSRRLEISPVPHPGGPSRGSPMGDKSGLFSGEGWCRAPGRRSVGGVSTSPCGEVSTDLTWEDGQEKEKRLGASWRRRPIRIAGSPMRSGVAVGYGVSERSVRRDGVL